MLKRTDVQIQQNCIENNTDNKDENNTDKDESKKINLIKYTKYESTIVYWEIQLE